jgi:hypothetical protein
VGLPRGLFTESNFLWFCFRSLWKVRMIFFSATLSLRDLVASSTVNIVFIATKTQKQKDSQ